MASDPDYADADHPELPGPESIDAITADRKRRHRRLIVGGVVAVLLVGGGGAAALVLQDAQASAQVDGAWSAFHRCLLGPGLEPGERPSRRLRAAQLAAMGLDDKQRAPEKDVPWPNRCAPLAHGLSVALDSTGRDDRKALAPKVEALAKALKEPRSFAADLSGALEEIWPAVEQAAVKLSAASVEGPPIPAVVFTADALASVEGITKTSTALKGVHVEPHAAGALRILVDDRALPTAPLLCTFPAAAPAPAAATCARLPAPLASSRQGLRLLATADDDAAPLVFAGNRGSEGVFRADTGAQVDALYSYGGHAASDGHAAVLGWNEAKREPVLVRAARGKDKGERTTLEPGFEVGNYYYSSQLLWDQVLLRGVKDGQRRLFAQEVRRDGAPLGEAADVGPLEEPGLVSGGADEPPHIAGCRAGDDLVVRVKGYDNDFMSFRVGGKWSQPVSPELTGGTLSCSKAGAAITRIEPAGSDNPWKTTISHVRCTSAGCQPAQAKVEQMLPGGRELAPREGKIDAAALGDKLLVVWAAGERGGVRMRLAPVEQMAAAKDVVIYDDLVKDGKVQPLSTLFDLRLFSREGFAVLLLSTTSGVHAIRVDPDGKIALVPVAWK